MSRRVNVRTRVRNVSRSRVEGRTPTRSRHTITGRSPSPYEIGTPENYRNQRYKEV